MPYLLDANVFIQAKNLHYGFDFCPAFWDWIDRENKERRVYCIERVGDELRAGADELAQWAEQMRDRLFPAPEPSLLAALPRVSTWVTSQTYSAAAVNTFLHVADYYLVSQALARGDVVVTHEHPANSVNKVKIPNVCIGLGVKCMTPYEMHRAERARFILGEAP
ncbi:MAG: DUF4411 family protein [Longimicrobiales bacterium]